MSNNITKFLNSRVIELSSQTIELASVDILEAMLKESKDIYKDGVSFASEMTAFQKRSKTLNARAAALISGVNKELSEFSKQANHLGIDPTSVKAYNDLKTSLGPIDTVESQTAKFK
tara:strand:+ start:434 stop:784 length:351 start_codon:yes stop_codon:yes gene_type:complete